MRLFYAVKIPEDIKQKLKREVQKLEDLPLKFVATHHYHVTLLFLGEVEARNLKLLTNAIEKDTFEKFYMSMKGMGVFYDRQGAVRVVYKDIKEGRENLKNIHDYLTERSGEALENRKKRKYEPHLTLARGSVRERAINEAIKKRVADLDREGEGYRILVKEVLLVRSDLTGHGSEYREVAKLLLSQ